MAFFFNLLVLKRALLQITCRCLIYRWNQFSDRTHVKELIEFGDNGRTVSFLASSTFFVLVPDWRSHCVLRWLFWVSMPLCMIKADLCHEHIHYKHWEQLKPGISDIRVKATRFHQKYSSMSNWCRVCDGWDPPGVLRWWQSLGVFTHSTSIWH